MSSHDRVAVAGMGPVGMVAALTLAEAGLQVVVYEKGADLATESRASTFHPPTLEMLDELGLAADLIATGLKAPVFQQRDRRDGVLADLDLSVLADETPFPFRLQNEQVKLTRLVRARLEAMDNVELRFGGGVERVENGADRVDVYQAGSSTPESYAWLVGADGASSATRITLGIAFEGITYPERFLVISSEFDWQAVLPGLANVTYVSDPSEWMVLLRTPRHWRALFPVGAGETNEQALIPEAIQGRLQGVHARDEPYPVLHTTLYNVHQRVAASFSVGRILLVGDAAHINNPLGGMGMNSGIHDAVAAARTIVAAQGAVEVSRFAASYNAIRRGAALDYVQTDTQQNLAELKQTDDEARRRRADMYQALVRDPDALRAHLRRTSMLASAHRMSARLDAALLSNRRLAGRPHLATSLRRSLVTAVTCSGVESARLAEKAGATCLVLSASRRDGDGTVDGLDWREVATLAGEIAPLVGVPLLVEAGRGWHAEVEEMVEATERAGVAGVVIVDLDIDGAVEVDAQPVLTDESLMVRLISQAIAARESMLIIAGTEAFGLVESGSALGRCRRYARAGADLVLFGHRSGEGTRVSDVVIRDVPAVPLARWSYGLSEASALLPDDSTLVPPAVRLIVPSAQAATQGPVSQALPESLDRSTAPR